MTDYREATAEEAGIRSVACLPTDVDLTKLAHCPVCFGRSKSHDKCEHCGAAFSKTKPEPQSDWRTEAIELLDGCKAWECGSWVEASARNAASDLRHATRWHDTFADVFLAKVEHGLLAVAAAQNTATHPLEYDQRAVERVKIARRIKDYRSWCQKAARA